MPSPVGEITLVADENALCFVGWGESLNPHHHEVAQASPIETHPILDEAIRQLTAYFQGELFTFNLPLNPGGTPFQQQAWRALLTIPYGQTVSYGEQARKINNPAAVRAIGGANGKNPIGIIIPCHRVIGANGSLTGYGGGLPAKSFLLEHERRFSTSQMALFG